MQAEDFLFTQQLLQEKPRKENYTVVKDLLTGVGALTILLVNGSVGFLGVGCLGLYFMRFRRGEDCKLWSLLACSLLTFWLAVLVEYT